MSADQWAALDMTTPATPETCEKCGKPIEKGRGVWLEIDLRTFEHVTPGTIPEEYSQGCFYYGAECAAKLRKLRSVS